MNKDEIKSHLENLADDSGVEITSRQIVKFVNLALELKDEADISYEELLQEFQSISPSDEDEWMDFVEEVADFVFDYIAEENEDEIEEDEE
jgi:uncharacterized protein YpuA (DUF1002 family)